MDSMPPATIGPDRSPARTYWSARPTARRLEAQTLFTVSEGTSLGMPPLIWAWREGTWPWPAWRTWPNTTCSTCSGATSARSRAPRMAVPPSSIASTEARARPILPNGVRAVLRMTVLGMRARIVTGRGRPRPGYLRYLSSRTGMTMRPNVLLVTLAKDAYQAAIAVAIPIQPPAFTIESVPFASPMPRTMNVAASNRNTSMTAAETRNDAIHMYVVKIPHAIRYRPTAAPRLAAG